MCDIDDQVKFHAGSRLLTAGALGNPEGWDREGGGKSFRTGGHVYTCVYWPIHTDVWQKLCVKYYLIKINRLINKKYYLNK